MAWTVRVLDGVDVPTPLAAHVDQPAQAQFAQVLAHRGGPHAGALGQRGDVVHAFRGQPHGVQPRRVAEQCERVGGRGELGSCRVRSLVVRWVGFRAVWSWFRHGKTHYSPFPEAHVACDKKCRHLRKGRNVWQGDVRSDRGVVRTPVDRHAEDPGVLRWRGPRSGWTRPSVPQ